MRVIGALHIFWRCLQGLPGYTSTLAGMHMRFLRTSVAVAECVAAPMLPRPPHSARYVGSTAFRSTYAPHPAPWDAINRVPTGSLRSAHPRILRSSPLQSLFPPHCLHAIVAIDL